MNHVPSSWSGLIQAEPPQIQGDVCPQKNIFRSLHETTPANCRIVFLGMDPYPTPGVANGLAFSVDPGRAMPGSLKNIFQEYQQDLSLPQPQSGDLLPWAREGVLLLNSSLTTKPHAPGSHEKLWQSFTDEILLVLEKTPIIALGQSAQKKCLRLDIDPALLIQAPHPSPLSAWRGFFGSSIFSASNQLLRSLGRETINWRLP